jgi:hypothetical protein
MGQKDCLSEFALWIEQQVVSFTGFRGVNAQTFRFQGITFF